MATHQTASELAREWREERLDFNDALIQHLEGNVGLEPDPALVLGIGIAVSWVNMGLSDTVLDLPGYPQMAAGEIVKKFGLTPFLDCEEQG
jgi:hypothetical protein